MRFFKYHGAGNDFVIADRRATAGPLEPSDVVTICRRHFGVGADGVLEVRVGDVHPHRMIVHNADGSIAEMCGNGIRCVAGYLVGHLGVDGADIPIETGAGVKRCRCLPDGPGRYRVAVDMGIAEVAGGDAEVVDIDGRRYPFVRVSTGNPHAIIFEGPELATFREDARRLSSAPTFPHKTNVEHVRQRPDGSVDVVVYERGVGFTLACGTGACATAAAAVTRGIAPPGAPLAVHLPGGTLTITVDAQTGAITLEGPAREVFSGTIDGID